MNQMEIFKNPEFGSVRVIEENGKYLFCGLDVTVFLSTGFAAVGGVTTLDASSITGASALAGAG